MLSVIVPANDEADYIGECLGALLRSAEPVFRGPQGGAAVEIVVVANGCTDDTAARARAFAPQAEARGWRLVVIEVARGGKLNALNVGDAAASGDKRVYVDADIRVSPGLLAQLAAALDLPGPTYASGRPTLVRARTWVSRAYTRFWGRVPFNTTGVPGFGVFAVNAAGRARWDAFPEIISDDTFVRLQFAPGERIGVPATYEFPLPEGFAPLVRVRRRQNRGVAEVARDFPWLLSNDDKPRFGPAGVVRAALADPSGFCVYVAVALAARLRAGRQAGVWARGR